MNLRGFRSHISHLPIIRLIKTVETLAPERLSEPPGSQGVGTALLSACVDFARQLQRPMEWATAAENTGAKRLYAKVARVAEPSVRYVV